jgi:serine/threonine-protein kinase
MPTATSLDDLRQRLGDRYAIERELGRGGMGAVYLARDLRLDRPVALKVLPPEFASDAALRERFLRETRTAASFSHPNIVPVHAVEEREGLLAFAMGFVEGESVAERVRRSGPLDVRAIVRMLQDIGYALAYAHGRGVVHRDIKPDNIMLERATGRALLMDFGISRTITTTVEKHGLTRVGEVVGTPEYMSPEQASGDTADGRSDIYSLGLVALFVLTGRPAITADTTQKILVKQLTELPPAAASLRPDLPTALAAAIDRCVAKLPDERFATAEALVEVIDDARLSEPEIPLPVRLFAQELGTLGLVLVFLTILTPFLVKGMSTGGDLDALIPVIMLLAVGLTRVLQSFTAARRLAVQGFGPAEVRKGMHAVLDERESLRQQLRADADTRRRRRNTVAIAWLQMALAVALVWATRARRVEVAPHRFAVGMSGVVMGTSAIVLFFVSFVLLMRSPLRASIGERAFRWVWLGPFGRAFMSFSARGIASPASARATPVVPSATSATAPSQVAAPTAAPADRLAALEARLAELEKARDPKQR